MVGPLCTFLYNAIIIGYQWRFKMKKIILASTSISRKQQLQRLNITFDVIPPLVDEKKLKQKISDHRKLSRELSRSKVQSISKQFNKAIIIGGDTITSFNGSIVSKPKTKENAFKQLKMLNGNEHQVITSAAISVKDKVYIHTIIAKMKMRQLSSEQISRYIEYDQPLHSCGSCRLDSMGISLFDSIDCEDYTSIIGIPLMWTSKILNEHGVAIP